MVYEIPLAPCSLCRLRCHNRFSPRIVCHSGVDPGSEGNADDELWDEVEPESDPPHEAAVYAE